MSTTEIHETLTGFEIIRLAKAQLHEATGLEPETVSELRYDDPFWLVVVEMLEVARVPAATDVLGSYLVRMDEHGRMIQYQRLRRYARSQVPECE